MNTAGGVVAGELEVADRDTRQSVKRLEGDGLAQYNVVENRAQRSYAKVGR